jgi:hypothetical protein
MSILKQRCGVCHGASPQYGASTTVTTWEGLSKNDPKNSGKKVWETLNDWIQGTPSPMPPPPNPRLTEAEAAVIGAWVRNGAPRSADVCTIPESPGSKEPTLDCNADQNMRPTTPWVVDPNGPLDDYVCYGFDVNNTQKRHVVAMAPKPDNKSVLHHILLFQSDTSYGGTPRRCSFTNSARWKLVTGWAPGGQPAKFPVEAGLPQKQGANHYIVQLHYNNALKLPNQKDATGYDFCTTDKLRPYDAGIVGFGKVDVTGTSFSIPPRTNNYEIECTYTLPSQFKEVTFFGASPHMHKLGKGASTYFLPGGSGAPIKLVDVQDFSFDSQVSYPVTVKARAGDLAKTRCRWSNPTDTRVTWGEATNEEMCFNFGMYYPEVPDSSAFFGYSGFSWIAPAQQASCRTVGP